MPRVNRVIELFEQGQPVYYTGVGLDERSYEGGKAAAHTWADYLAYEMEHGPLDITALDAFMRGLVDGGPTRSGHRTPTVIVTLPVDGGSAEIVRANEWMFKQVLACGVHGILLCNADTPDAVRTFVEATRYPFSQAAVGSGLERGRRGNGGQDRAAHVWGLSIDDYFERADPWPLEPKGELLLGLKFENPRAVSNAEVSARVPGISFAEWGPGDNGMWLGHPNNHDEPYPDDMWAVRQRIKSICQHNKLFFLESVTADNVTQRIDEGVMICAGRRNQPAAKLGRAHTRRTMPA